MIKISSLSIQKKIMLIPFVAAIGFVTFFVVSYITMHRVELNLKQAFEIDYQLLKTAELSLSHLDKIKDNLGNAVTLGEIELLDAADKLSIEFKEHITQAALLDITSTSQLDTLSIDFNAYYREARKLSAEMVDGSIDFSTVGDRSQAMSERLTKLNEELKAFHTERYKRFTSAFTSVSKDSERVTVIGIIVGVVTTSLLFIVAIPIANTIHKSLKDIIASLKDIAKDNGDLTVRLSTKSKDEVGDLVYWFNTFIEKLQVVIKSVVDITPPVAETSVNIQQLSEQSLASLNNQIEDVNSSKMSVDEMSESILEITQNASNTADATKNAGTEAEKGQRIVEQTVQDIRALVTDIDESANTINALSQDVNQVNVVLDVIKGIADQTNLLALNAAIEAARAGEHGRGFAVVADEVRSLASRTQESIEEINQMLLSLQSTAKSAVTMIVNSQKSVDATVINANKAGDSLVTINKTVRNISAMSEAIAVATEQQSQVSGIMVGNFESIKNGTDAVAGASNQVANVSERLAQYAIQLEDITKQFKV